MSCREYNGWVNQWATTLVDIVRFACCRNRRPQDSNHPREFSILWLVVFKICDANIKAITVAYTAGWNVFRTQWHGWNDFRYRFRCRHFATNFDRTGAIASNQSVGHGGNVPLSDRFGFYRHISCGWFFAYVNNSCSICDNLTFVAKIIRYADTNAWMRREFASCFRPATQNLSNYCRIDWTLCIYAKNAKI